MPEIAVWRLGWGFYQTLVSDSWNSDRLTCLSSGLAGRRVKLIAWLTIGRYSRGFSGDVRDGCAQFIMAEI